MAQLSAYGGLGNKMRFWFPVLPAILLLFGSVADTNAAQPSADTTTVHTPTYAGLPRTDSAGPVTVLHNHGFIVGYSEHRRDPLWVAFRVQAVYGAQLPPRPRFRRDPRSPAGVSYYDFAGSGYDRGHLAPNYSMARLYGRDAQRQTFLMTNITPQRPRLNQLVWQRIEEAEIDVMAARWGELWVITGPVFGAHPEHLPSGVTIPQAFYRLWLDVADNGSPRVLALLVPQDVRGDEALSDFVTTVDHIEALTGLDFYADLPVAEQARLESQPAQLPAWEFAAIACAPARYAKGWQDEGGIHLHYDRCN